MPALSVLPLGSTTVTSTYSELHSSNQGFVSSPSSSSSSTKEQRPGKSNMDAPEAGNDVSTDSCDDKDAVTAPEKAIIGSAAPDKGNALKGAAVGVRDGGNFTAGAGSPSQSTNSSYPHPTPQQQHNYYIYNSQFTTEPPSPHGGGPAVYDVGSFFQQPTVGGFHSSPFTTVAAHPYGSQLQPPNSPTSHSVGIPPASPLFPRMTGGPATASLLNSSVQRDSVGNPALSPGPTYMTSQFGPSGVYMTPGGMNGNGNNVNEDLSSWGDSRTIVYPPSPQISGQGIPHIPYVPGMPPRSVTSDRSGSFDDSMLPPSVDSQQQHYGAGSPGQISGTGAGPFAHQQAWGYGAPPHEMYGVSSPLQPRPTMPHPGQLGGPPNRHHPHHPPHLPHMPAYGSQYYPATSPGPPIQTTTSNKGPDGANLFIFHIPNHFTNLDMYNLFIQYGQLLSVRIMVEKDSGRSRGFGFVSYDSPDAAAHAIKELNGFAIGNKRLKVQHKQIRASDMHYDRNLDPATSDPAGLGGNQGQHNGMDPFGGVGMRLPPSGPMAMSASWYNRPSAGVPPLVPSHSDDEGLTSHVVVVGDDSTTPSPVLPGGAIIPAGSEVQPDSDPLSTMEALRQNLPDVGGAAIPAAVGEN